MRSRILGGGGRDKGGKEAQIEKYKENGEVRKRRKDYEKILERDPNDHNPLSRDL